MTRGEADIHPSLLNLVHYDRLHDWNLTPTEAVALQKSLRDRVRIEPLPETATLVAGTDVSFEKYSDEVYAAIVVVRLPSLEVEASVGVATTAAFPYIPGLFSFREAPPLLEAWDRLEVRPDVVMVDGQGIAHPRRLGIASHLGLLIGVPTVGCAKSILVGKYDEPGELAGSHTPLVHRGETIGAALRTRDRVSPVYVSPGHGADIPSSIALAMRCVRGYAQGRSRYRIPDPTRLAHLCANAMRRGEVWVPPRP
jgi:deoxyribonuclease V